MSDKSLKDKAIDIKGKDYVLVSDRIIYFNDNYPNGSITTDLISPVESDIIVVKATVNPNDIVVGSDDTGYHQRAFTGYSQAVKGAGFINKTAALENAETSAVGRALAMMGIGVIDSVASVDEINKAQGTDPKVANAKSELFQVFKDNGIDDFNKQLERIEVVLGKRTVDTVAEADEVIRSFSNEKPNTND